MSDDESSLINLELLGKEADTANAAETTQAGKTNRPWGGAGKAPMRSVDIEQQRANKDTADLSEVVQPDDMVEEYDFSKEIEVEDSDDEGRDTEAYKKPHQFKRLQPEVISLCSSDAVSSDVVPSPDFSHCAWRGMNLEQRREWELMYCDVITYPLYGDWGNSEDYQREKDKEMERYIADFPITEWVLPKRQIETAYMYWERRRRSREFGARIFDHQHMAQTIHDHQLIPCATAPAKGQHGHASSQRRPPQAHSARGQSQEMPQPHGTRTMPNEPQAQVAQRSCYGGVPAPDQILRSQPLVSGAFTDRNGAAPQQASGTSDMIVGTLYQLDTPAYTQLGSKATTARKRSRGKGKATDMSPDSGDSAHRTAHPPTPPYEVREELSEGKIVDKSGKVRTSRRQAQAIKFPWNRKMDFVQAAQNATWDDSIYDPVTLMAFNATREHNVPRLWQETENETIRLRNNRLAKKEAAAAGGASETEKPTPGGNRRKGTTVMPGIEADKGGDPYHTGSLCFATTEDVEKARAFVGANTPNEVIEAVQAGQVTLDTAGKINICFAPGKKGIAQELEQAQFSVRDTILTREQLAHTPILTMRAAECVIDFCPDLLWREMLLRITSEGGIGNKSVRDRMCLNGNYCDKATITKRIGAALGQKQQTAPSRKNQNEAQSSERIKGEEEKYEINSDDYTNYMAWFGHRSSHRSISLANTKKRKAQTEKVEGRDSDLEASSLRSNKRAKVAVGAESKAKGPEGVKPKDSITNTPSGDEDVHTIGVKAEDTRIVVEDEVDNANAVSVRRDTLLDEIED